VTDTFSSTPISLSPDIEMILAEPASPVSASRSPWVWFIELTHLAHIEMPFGEAYLWIVCESGGGYFSKTDYLSRATYFESEQRAREFLEVFPFVKGTVFQAAPYERRYLSNSFERSVLFHLWFHRVFNYFPQGVLQWKTLLSGLLRAKLLELAPPSPSTALKCPTESRSNSKARAASSSPEPSDCPLLFPLQ
jgi:hypothetical protein